MTKGHWLILWMFVSFGLWVALFFGAIIVGLQFVHTMTRLGVEGLATLLALGAGLILVMTGIGLHWFARRHLRDALFERSAVFVVIGGAVLLAAGSGASVVLGAL